jgi:hypothetical protein
LNPSLNPFANGYVHGKIALPSPINLLANTPGCITSATAAAENTNAAVNKWVFFIDICIRKWLSISISLKMYFYYMFEFEFESRYQYIAMSWAMLMISKDIIEEDLSYAI